MVIRGRAPSRCTRHGVRLVVLIGILHAGCSLEFIPGGGNGNDNGNANDNSPAADTVRIEFVNQTTTEAVDVQFYATNDPLEVLPDDLFLTPHRVRQGIGLGGTGVIGPLDGDAITFDCTDNFVLGTRGGSFVDAETGELRGVGSSVFAQSADLGFCGGTVTLLFRKEGDAFVARIMVEPPPLTP